MKFDLAGPRCVKEYEYYQRLAGLGQLLAEEGPQDVSLALMFLTKPVLRVGANGMAREGARTCDREFEVPLEWNATRRKTRHLAAVMVGWNDPQAQVNVIRRDQLRRVYVGLPLFWEDVPFSSRAEIPPACAYLGFRMIFEVPDDPPSWIALSEHAVLYLKAVYFEVLDLQRLYCVPSSVRRVWGVMGLEGILAGVEEGVAETVIRLVGYIERIKWGCVNSEYLQRPDVPGAFTPVFHNGYFVMFDVAELVSLLGQDGMVETEPQEDESRVAL